MKSLQCTVTIGTTSGYYHNNEYAYDKFFRSLQDYLESKYETTDDDDIQEKSTRVGGFGSTSEEQEEEEIIETIVPEIIEEEIC